jgi:hypothetical protein
MGPQTPTVSIRNIVGGALRFVRENWRFLAVAASMAAAANTAVTALGLGAPQVSVVSGILSGLLQAFAYAAFTGAALYGTSAVRTRWAGDGRRVWAAMALIAFFLLITFTVVTIPVMITLYSGPLAAYLPELERAGQDQAAVLAVMTRIAEEQPGVLLGLIVFYGVIWLLLTSRLYLAAPASVDAGRVLTFETWGWTKGAIFRIVAARLMLLAPANIFTGALGYLAGRLFGVDALAPSAATNIGGLLAYVFVASFLTFALYASLEAGLSAAFYRALKQQAPPQP